MVGSKMSFDPEVTAHLTSLAIINRALRENARRNCGKVCNPADDALLLSSLESRHRDLQWLSERGMQPNVGDNVYRYAHTLPES